jgi:hypothetical protein
MMVWISIAHSVALMTLGNSRMPSRGVDDAAAVATDQRQDRRVLLRSRVVAALSSPWAAAMSAARMAEAGVSSNVVRHLLSVVVGADRSGSRREGSDLPPKNRRSPDPLPGAWGLEHLVALAELELEGDLLGSAPGPRARGRPARPPAPPASVA